MNDPKSASARLGVIIAAHGLKGWVKIRSFTENPADLFGYPLADSKGNPVSLTWRGAIGDKVLASVEGVRDRNAAEALRGTELFAPESALPVSDEDGYRFDDLTGLAVFTADGTPFGTVTGVFNFGAGDIVEVTPAEGKAEMYSFDEATFPAIDLEAGRMTIAPPEILAGKPQ